jgi:hypothetical protein
MAERGCPLLTVEEAAAVLRIGRTKAYAMAREWRATGGRSGLPVVDLGNVLRVPVAQLEARLGVTLDLSAPRAPVAQPAPAVPPAPRPKQRLPTRTTQSRDVDQLNLLDPDAA